MHNPDGNMGSQWAEGVFLGYSLSSNTYIVHNAEGVTTARTVRRRPENERWSADRLASQQAIPWSIYERPATRVRFRVDAQRKPRNLQQQCATCASTQRTSTDTATPTAVSNARTFADTDARALAPATATNVAQG